MEPGSEGLESRIPILKRLPRLDLLPDNPTGNAAKIVADALADPALIPEPDRERIGEKITSTTEAESRFFLGRDVDIASALSWLRVVGQAQQAVGVISGAAGEGKSTFIHAGLIPALRRGLLGSSDRPWKIATVALSSNPVEETIAALGEQIPALKRPLSPDQPQAETASLNIEQLLRNVVVPQERLAIFFEGLDTVALRYGWEGEPHRTLCPYYRR